jgi:hypothetical protein
MDFDYNDERPNSGGRPLHRFGTSGAAVEGRSHGSSGFLDFRRAAQHVGHADRDDSACHRPDPVRHTYSGNS